MIKNNNQKEEYSNYNKIYVPTNLKNQNYSYRFNNDYIIIVTNNNCYTNYNTQYCDCYSYNYKNNVVSSSYSCNTSSNNTQIIPYTSITDDVNYSEFITKKYTNDYILYLLIFIIGIILANWLTKERKHV